MTMLESQSAKIVAVLQASYPNVKLGAGAETAYHLMLSEHEYETAMTLLPAILRDHPDFCPPAPALAVAIERWTRPALDPAEAWEAVCAERRRVGSWRAPEFSDPLISRAVESVGGWLAVCATEMQDEGTLRAQFRDIFTAFARRDAREANLDALPGSPRSLAALGAGLKRMPK